MKFEDFYKTASMTTIKHYMKCLFESLSVLEDLNVVHRDVKPDNFLYNTISNKGVLIDFGIAVCDLSKEKQSQYPDLVTVMNEQKQFNKMKVGTKGFLAPEVIFDTNKIGHKSDVWAAGVILLSFFTLKLPFFLTEPEFNASNDFFRDFIPLILTFGADTISALAKDNKVNIFISQEIKDSCYPKGFKDFYTRNDIDDKAHQFLSNCLNLDMKQRYSAKAALSDPWLQSI